MSAVTRWLRPLLPPLAALLTILGERIVAATPARWPLTALGLLALLTAIGWTKWQWWSSRGSAHEDRRAWFGALLPQGAMLLAAALYGVALLLPARPALAAWAAPAQFGAAVLLLIGMPWWLLVEMALWNQPMGRVDAGRVQRAGTAGLQLGLVLALVVTVNYSLSKMPWQWDVAYFKITEPSQATRDALGALEQPIEAGVFFTSDSAVGRMVGAYFNSLNRSAPGKLTVAVFDADVSPEQAKHFKARGNGMAVLKRDEQAKPIQIGTALDRARPALRKLDGDVLAAILELSRERRTAYLTIGHGERNEKSEDEDSTSAIRNFETLLRGRGYLVKPLGLVQGLGTTVPDDTGLLIVAGPTLPFSTGEAESVRRYLARGGRMLALLEPRPERDARRRGADPLLKVLEEYGIAFENVVQANERVFARRTYTPADFALLVTNAFGAHPAATTVRRAPDQFPLIAMTAGALSKGQVPAGLQWREVAKGMPGTWGDRNGNFRFDPPEERRTDPVLAVGVGPADPKPGKAGDPAKTAEPRLLVFADADVASDLLLPNRSNAAVLADGIAWLAGDEAPAGLPTSEEDQRIQHAKGDDWVWFYLPVIGVPALVLAVGLLFLARRRVTAGSPS